MNARSAESSHKTGEMLYCMDYDPGYTHTKPYNDGYFCEKYRDSAHLDENTRLYFYSESLPVVYASGERCSSPAIRDASGAWLLPLRDIVEKCGGEVEWRAGAGTVVSLDGRKYVLRYADGGYYIACGGAESFYPASPAVAHYCACLPAEAFASMGFEVRADESGEITVNCAQNNNLS